jgi:hypothetical protein
MVTYRIVAGHPVLTGPHHPPVISFDHIDEPDDRIEDDLSDCG